MKAIYCRKSIVGSSILRAVMWSKWSHCALITKDNTVIEAAMFHGVREVPLAEFLKDKSKLETKDIPLPDDDAAIQFAREQIGKPYDWPGALGLGLRRDWNEAGAWFCSELVEAAASAGGRQRFINDAWRVTPQHSWMVA